MHILALFIVFAFVAMASLSTTTMHAQRAVSDHAITTLNRTIIPDSVERAFVEALNAVRKDPKSFLPALDVYERYVISFTPNKKKLKVALKEIRARLKKQTPLLPLTMHSALQGAADDHVVDLSRGGLMSHIGSDGSNPLTRVQRYEKLATIGECITMGYMTTDLMVASMLVDEGTPDRGHRENLLKPTYGYIGVGIADHPSLRIATVVVLGAD